MPRKREKAADEAEQPTSREPGDEPVRPAEPNPRSWAIHNVAGVECLTRRDPYDFMIRFKEKPPAPVLDFLRDAGFQWKPGDQAWTRPIGYSTGSQDREVGRRTYNKIVEMLLAEKGLGSEVTPF